MKRPTANAYTFIELLAAIFIVTVAMLVYMPLARRHGTAAGIGGAFLAIVVCVLIVIQFYRWSGRRDKRRLQELREKYQNIYLVKSLPPDDGNARLAEDAEIQVGDFGWEAAPLRGDGLIYLQGLTAEWHVVWHAGFRPDQIEKVATKPASQYDYWRPYWSKSPPPPSCPFPIHARATATMGRPHHSNRYFEHYPIRNKPTNG